MTSCLDSLGAKETSLTHLYIHTVESVIEVGLVFNFWILGADFYLSFYQFLLNKCPHFHEFLRLLFESVFFSSQTTITDCTVFVTYL